MNTELGKLLLAQATETLQEIVSRTGEALVPSGDAGIDYELREEVNTVWIKVGVFDICINRLLDGGVGCEVYKGIAVDPLGSVLISPRDLAEEAEE
jgi:hypothetical protein